jgi:hypothetical protein
MVSITEWLGMSSFRSGSYFLGPTPGQLLLNKIGETILFQHAFWQEGRSFDLSKATGASAKAFEGLYHLPFRGWIEKCHFFFRLYFLQRYNLHGRCVEKHIGVATVVYILKKFRLHGDVITFTKLNGQVRGFFQDFPGGEFDDHITGFKRFPCEEKLLIDLEVLTDLSK